MNSRILPGLALATALTIPAVVTPGAALADTSAHTSAAGAVAAPKPLAGVAVYLSYGKGYPISRYEPGRGFTKLGGAPDTFQFAASPDGEKLAWITMDGRVHVGSGRSAKVVAKGADAGAPCATPVWSPDSAHVAYLGRSNADASPLMIVKADGTGARKAGRTRGVCHLAWSGGGWRLAGYAGTTEGVYTLDLKSGRSARAKGVKLANHVQSLSPDGRKVVVHALSPAAPGGDGVWPTAFNPTIFDTVTGRRVPIPVRGTKLGAFYLEDGRLVVRVAGRAHNTLVVLDSAGRELQRLAEPARARRLGLLQIVK
ncbi:TolB family protein [Sphaerimonospora cavernae]|uniref:TolB family protein n=1 Tax=Sphaerimonospora cavernae TaxID=1740611 RepID=A0ABV6TZ18_9ACTN